MNPDKRLKGCVSSSAAHSETRTSYGYPLNLIDLGIYGFPSDLIYFFDTPGFNDTGKNGLIFFIHLYL